MNINEFTALIKALFRNEKGRPYQVDNYMITEIFNIFNKQGVSNFLNYDYIKNCYRSKYVYLLPSPRYLPYHLIDKYTNWYIYLLNDKVRTDSKKFTQLKIGLEFDLKI